MLLEVRKYLFDIQIACQLITEFTREQTFSVRSISLGNCRDKIANTRSRS